MKALGRFKDVFAKGNEPLKSMCNMAEHEIPLVLNAKPVYQSLGSGAYKKQLIHRELISKMKARGANEVSFGPWGARVLLAQMKDGTWRFCVDYRLLNALTVNSVYPMPSIDGTLARLHGAKIFSIMDQECGYWQIPIKKKDRMKTAFITADGVCMLFGLCTAPSTFQQTMDLVLGGGGYGGQYA